jgi:hypothetical protein
MTIVGIGTGPKVEEIPRAGGNNTESGGRGEQKEWRGVGRRKNPENR